MDFNKTKQLHEAALYICYLFCTYKNSSIPST